MLSHTKCVPCFTYLVSILNASESMTLQLLHQAATCPHKYYDVMMIQQSRFLGINEGNLLLIFHPYKREDRGKFLPFTCFREFLLK